MQRSPSYRGIDPWYLSSYREMKTLDYWEISNLLGPDEVTTRTPSSNRIATRFHIVSSVGVSVHLSLFSSRMHKKKEGAVEILQGVKGTCPSFSSRRLDRLPVIWFEFILQLAAFPFLSIPPGTEGSCFFRELAQRRRAEQNGGASCQRTSRGANGGRAGGGAGRRSSSSRWRLPGS